MEGMLVTGPELRRIRLDKGLTLRQLARLLRIESLTSVHRWEQGLRPISGPVSLLMEMIDAGTLTEEGA